MPMMCPVEWEVLEASKPVHMCCAFQDFSLISVLRPFLKVSAIDNIRPYFGIPPEPARTFPTNSCWAFIFNVETTKPLEAEKTSTFSQEGSY